MTPTPGTTRDVVTTRLAIDGWPVELADTAGVRDATDVLETQGVRMARETTAAADLCLWVLDASAAPVWPEFQGTVQLVVNKIDRPAAWDPNEAAGAVRVSALTGAGLAELCPPCPAGWSPTRRRPGRPSRSLPPSARASSRPRIFSASARWTRPAARGALRRVDLS